MIRFNQPGIPQCSRHRGWSCVPQSSSFQWAKRKVNWFWQASGFRSGNVGFEKEVVWLQLEKKKLQPEILDTQPVILVKGVVVRNTLCIAYRVLRVWIIHPVLRDSPSLHDSLCMSTSQAASELVGGCMGGSVATALPQACSAAAPFPLLTWQQRPCWTNIACSSRSSSSPSFSLSSSLPSLFLSSWLSQSQTIETKKALLDNHGMNALICAPCVFVQQYGEEGQTHWNINVCHNRKER